MKLSFLSKSEPKESAFDILEAGATTNLCALYLRGLEPVERLSIYNGFEYERLVAKYEQLMELYEQACSNWHQTLFYRFMITLGDDKNKDAYQELARRVGYSAVLRERSNPLSLEALLLGASGLLDRCLNDDYIVKLKREAEFLLKKYDITPMHSKNWVLDRIRPANAPILRLAQAATLFSQQELFFDKVLECENYADIAEIFGVAASDYWTTYSPTARPVKPQVKRIGTLKCNSIGINVVAPIQFAYGKYIDDELIMERSHSLLESLKAESNTFVDRWAAKGVMAANAYESQALLQLSKIYCAQKKCRECTIGQRAAKNLSWLNQ